MVHTRSADVTVYVYGFRHCGDAYALYACDNMIISRYKSHMYVSESPCESPYDA